MWTKDRYLEPAKDIFLGDSFLQLGNFRIAENQLGLTVAFGQTRVPSMLLDLWSVFFFN